ncbi:hypothetical protein [Paenibacillus xylanilyticus]|uniref:hypothetical protein n=1 Tax=Paenibacillus xylanilyticus TaxID=248903 RepID=UPI003AB05BD5
MAKLNVVIPAVEVTVDVEGKAVTYRKVDRKAQAGDIVKMLRNGLGISYGDYFAIDADLKFLDNDGGTRSITHRVNAEHEVYEKVAVSTPKYREVKRKANVGERIKIVAIHPESMKVGSVSVGEEFTVKMVDATGDVWSVEERPIQGIISTRFQGEIREYVVLEPVTVEPPKPERLKVGDYARVTTIDDIDGSAPVPYVNVGDIFEISEDDKTSVPYYGKRVTDGKTACFMAERLVRATDEEVAAAKREDLLAQFTVGDTVKLTIQAGKNPRFGYGSVDNGDIGKVTEVFRTHIVVDFSPKQRGWKADPTELTKLTAEEVAEIEREQAEEARWNAIGRKVNEFKRGDIVEVTISNSGHAVGTIGELVSGSHFAIPTEFGVRANGSTKCHLSGLKLVTPVEQRFDTKEVDAA